MEYALLGWFACRDLAGKESRVEGIIFSILFASGVGIVDEVFQKILPYRVGDVRDVIFNSFGVLWGVGLYLLTGLSKEEIKKKARCPKL